MIYLQFSWLAAFRAVLGLVSYRRESLDALVGLRRSCAEEVEDYID